MSSPSTHVDVRSDSQASGDDDGLVDALIDHALKPVRAVGFWSAIALPFLYVPLLATGLGSSGELLVFLGLLAANVAAVSLGHSYEP